MNVCSRCRLLSTLNASAVNPRTLLQVRWRNPPRAADGNEPKLFVLPALDEESASTPLTAKSNYDREYLEDPSNFSEIIRNVKLREMKELSKLFDNASGDPALIKQVIDENIHAIPNRLHPVWSHLDPATTHFDKDLPAREVVGDKPKFDRDFVPKRAEKLMQRMKLLLLSSDRNLGVLGGQRSYLLLGDLARLESVLLDWTQAQLIEKFNFKPVIVPNLIYDDIVEACGFNPVGERSQVYTVDGNDSAEWMSGKPNKRTNAICLAGTAEIPLVSMHLGKCFEVDSDQKGEDLPKRYCALSRCYRAEISKLDKETGLYRVHYFNKVEMVALTRREDAEKTLEEFVEIQKYLFSQLGLHFKVIDMPPYELGPPARRKFDIEAWFAGRKEWGEISSASDCSDYQSRRLNIRYRFMQPDFRTNSPFKEDYVATVNGTACATPRLLLPLIEQRQDSRGRVKIPSVLRDAMGQEYLHKLVFR